jgi:hypothetical protein
MNKYIPNPPLVALRSTILFGFLFDTHLPHRENSKNYLAVEFILTFQIERA